MANKNKIRGNYYEEKIVKLYRKTLGLNQFECYRAGSSGARQTLEINGDISFSDPNSYPIITECKYRINLQERDLFPYISSQCQSWIDQTIEEKDRYIKYFNHQVLALLVMGRPYIKDDFVLIINAPDNFPELEGSRMICYSKPHNHYYTITTISEILKNLEKCSFVKK